MRHPLVTMSLLVVMTGCGPLARPMVERLEPDDQLKVDAAWERILAQSEQIDRQTLLDVLIAGQLHHLGVDELHFESRKQVGEHTVVMTVEFDRREPAADLYLVQVFDAAGDVIRAERYAFDEVLRTMQELFGEPVDEAAPHQPVLTQEDRQQRLQRAFEILGREDEVYN